MCNDLSYAVVGVHRDTRQILSSRYSVMSDAFLEMAANLSRKRKLREANCMRRLLTNSRNGSESTIEGSINHDDSSFSGLMPTTAYYMKSSLVLDPQSLLTVVVTPQTCYRYGLWSDALKTALASVRESRGPQVRPVVCGSLYTGMAGERKVLSCLDLHARFPFGVEMKEAAVRFLSLNEHDGSFDFVFKDVREFIEKNGVGKCHGQCEECDGKRAIGEVLDLLIAGPPCPPFSLARAGRIKEGTQTHADADGFLQFFKALWQFEPSIAVAENVAGMLAYCKALRCVPLTWYRERAKEMGVLNLYAVRVVILNSNAWLPHKRSRIYCLFIHTRVGGEAAARRAHGYLQDLLIMKHNHERVEEKQR